MLIFAAVLAACSQKVANTVPHEVKAATVATPQTNVTGKVLETVNAGGYTYLQVATASGDVWAAVQETKIEKGAVVSIAPQMVAENFESKTLNRKFDRLVMGALVSDATSTAAPHMSSAMAPPDGGAKVDKAEGGLTIAEAWASKNQLKDKPVVIRGKVVKFLPAIMGKNWLHLRDGSGEQDITVTTTDVAKIGDVVTARGTLHLDKDFGAGYVYPVIIEDARVGQ